MATWDGSYTEPDGSNYSNSNMSQVPGGVQNWDYYPTNVSNAFSQNPGPLPYESNNSLSFEANRQNICNLAGTNSVSHLVQNVTPNTNVYAHNYRSNEIQTGSRNNYSNTNHVPYFYENNIQPQQVQTQYPNANNTYYNSNKHRDMKEACEGSESMEYSNLQANAHEFVPNNKWSRKNGATASKNGSGRPKTSYQTQDNQVFFENNKKFYNERKFENKRDASRRWHVPQNDSYFKDDSKKDYSRGQNSRKHQNDKYGSKNNVSKDDSNIKVSENSVNNQERQLNQNQNSVRNSNDNFSLPVKSSKPYSNNIRSEKYFDKKDRFSGKDPRDRKMNYLDQGYSAKNNYGKENKYDRRATEQESRTKDITDWRQRANVNSENKSTSLKRYFYKKYEPDDAANQRESLTEQLNRGQLECLVCCEMIRQADYVWSCKNCFHVLHLKCTQKWATSSQDGSGWRCPACQNVSAEVPEDYECYCGKIKVPDWNRHDTAHSCGEVCGRSAECVHKCTLLCHPGSCPPCTTIVTKTCGCGRKSKSLKCCTGPLLQCEEICDRVLNCGTHKCEKKCHHGSCESCTKVIKQECFCGKHTRESTCELDLPPLYSCEDICERTLDCGNHKCSEICHIGECGPCILKPETVTHCCCGQTPLTNKRESCLDPIATCDQVCSKKLKCGQPSNPHSCKVMCHEGDCPACELITKVRCRCGYMDREIPCRELTTKADDARCEKKCTKKRTCGKHRCNQKCCIDIEHLCPLPCSKTLSCGRHKCDLTCHQGRCQQCWRSSFEELYCECGAEVIYPPVACGTRRPSCTKPCSREHSCDHEVLHNCHSDTNCPPCSVLTQKWCYGKHELRKAVPCYVNDVSCGMPCGKAISCGRHKCIQNCHPGECERPGQVCVQPCTIPRELCGHICGAPCHEGKCPDIPCKEMVKVNCQCGNRTMTRVCAENARDYQRIASGILASKMAEMQLGHSFDLEEVFGQSARKQNQLKTLECNEDCKIIERNRRLTVGLKISNPDLSGKLVPRYNDFMKQWAKKDPLFCQMVHDKLTELVQSAKSSKQKSRSYSFEVMNRDKRQFVHESCGHFGCESQAYDQEPKRNVVATANKDKCWLPSYSLLELFQRENGQRKVPGPMLNKSKLNPMERSKDVLLLSSKTNINNLPSSSSSSSSSSVPPSKTTEPEIDYFNYTG